MGNLLEEYNITYAQYPHEILQKSNTIHDITRWVNDVYGRERYDFIIGHSMGGIIALELVAEYGMECRKIILIESNLRPAKEFYRNLLMHFNMITLGDKVKDMIATESIYYNQNIKLSLQEEFDYTDLVRKVTQPIYGIYGDRGQPGYLNRIHDLCLTTDIEDRIIFSFIQNSCHMPMVENPEDLSNRLKDIMMDSL